MGNGKEWLEWMDSQSQSNDYWWQIRNDYELKHDGKTSDGGLSERYTHCEQRAFLLYA